MPLWRWFSVGRLEVCRLGDLRFGVSSFGYLSVVDTSPLPSPILISKEKWAYWSLKSGKARPDDSGRLTVKMSNFLVSSLFCREGTISIAKLSWRQYCCCCKYFFIKRLLWPIPLLHGTERFRRWEVRFPSSQLIMSTTSKTRVNQTGTASLSQDIPQTLSLGEAW